MGVALLALGQTLAWASLYYSFAALLVAWEETLGWGKPQLTLALTVAVLASALAAPLAGRLIDAGAGPWLLGGGAAFGALGLVGVASATTPTGFVAAWACVGLCHAGCLYEPCFATVTRALGPRARWAITRITLVAGFASALAFPFGAWSASVMGWRGAVVAFALVAGILAAPALFLGARIITRIDGNMSDSLGGLVPPSPFPLARRSFVLLGAAFTFMALNHGILINHLIPLLSERGISLPLAVAAASTVGPMQVAGRLILLRYEARAPALIVCRVAFGGVALAALLLLASGGSATLAFAVAAMQGAAYGTTSILKPVVTAQVLGTARYGVVAGWLAVPYLAGFALAPSLGALVWQAAGSFAMVLFAAALAVAGLAAVAALKNRSGPP